MAPAAPLTNLDGAPRPAPPWNPQVQPNGDVIVHSGGYHTRTTFLTILEALEPLGLTLESSLGHEGRGDWSVVDTEGSRTPWQDGMVLPSTSEADRGRGGRLLAAYGVGAGPSTTAPQAAAAGEDGRRRVVLGGAPIRVAGRHLQLQEVQVGPALKQCLWRVFGTASARGWDGSAFS
jgi:hypothetical protein